MSRRRTIVFALAVAALGAGLAALGSLLIDSSRPPAALLHERDFHFERADHTPLEITPQRPLILPFAFADFDLSAEFELAEGAELDLVHRLVEPVMREDGLTPFHARFHVLRLSTLEGAPVRTREQALFEDDVATDRRGGVPVSPGLPATVTMRARGRQTEAVLAGRRLESIETTDAHGQIAVLARGGRAVMHRLEIFSRPRPLALLPIGHAAIGGALLGWIAALWSRTRRGVAGWIGLAWLPLLAWGSTLVLWNRILPDCEPSTLALVLAALAGVPLALGSWSRRPVLGMTVGALGAAAMILYAIHLEQPRLTDAVDPRLDRYFGRDSGSAPFDALARRMYARDAVHGVEAVGERLVFLGGSALFESHPDKAFWIAPIVGARAAQLLPGRKFDAAVLPWTSTEGSVLQQIECFERFYAAPMAPRAVLLIVPSWESEGTPLDGFARAIDAFVDRSEGRACSVILGVDDGLAADFAAAVDGVARARSAKLLRVRPVEDPAATIESIAAELASRLR
ncbi:MAG: hypothetical protein AB7I19_09155 [Planctomycetota bacterium]